MQASQTPWARALSMLSTCLSVAYISTSCSDTQTFTDKAIPGMDAISDSTVGGNQAGQKSNGFPNSSDMAEDGTRNQKDNDRAKGGSKGDKNKNIPGGNGNASEVILTGEFRRTELFQFGGDSKSELVDYVVVLDNSCSMEGIGEKVASGFLSLATSAQLPAKAKIAVMSTMHADPSNLNRTGIGIRRYTGIDDEPGFLDFVDRAAIENYRKSSPNNAHKWALNGCENKWMSASDLDGNGQSCVVAATQSTNYCVGAEAGVRAFDQLIDKHANNSLFRRASVLNVIFVSDTHDPGTTVNALQSVPSYKNLVSKTLSKHNLAGIKFHAIAPSAPCTFEGSHEQSYYKLAKESEGLTEDPCKFTDYDDFMADMADISGEASLPVFSVSKPIKKIHSVRVNNQEVTDFIKVDPFSIKIPSLEDKKDMTFNIEIDYSY